MPFFRPFLRRRVLTRPAGMPAIFPAKGLEAPIPGAELTTQVLGKQASAEAFLYGGLVVSEGIRNTLAMIGRPIETFHDVLDFGCGSARVLRWFSGHGRTRWVGADISQEAIEWNRQHLGFGEFVTSGVEPPLPFPDGSFDLIYAISVVTHLEERLQFAWLREFRRLLRSGGVAMLSVHGEWVARWRLPPAEFEEYQRKGFQYKRVREGGLHGLPDFYQDAYHSRAYVLREWSRYFRPVAYIRNGPLYLQDLVILEMSPAAAGECLDLALPLGGFDQPRFGQEAAAAELSVAGWALQHIGGPVSIRVFIDGAQAASATANLPTPLIAAAYPAFSGAEACGFSAVVSTKSLASGPRLLQVGAEGQPIPSLSTYFSVPATPGGPR